jgi:hypothetical protein
MSESISDSNLRPIESALRALLPATPVIPRDRVLYEAGRRSASRRGWPILTGLFAAASVMLGLRVVTTPEPVVQIDYLPAPVQPSAGPIDHHVTSERPTEPTREGVLSLLLLGAPDYLPAQSPRAREIDHWVEGNPPGAAPIGAVLPIQPRDRLGLPPGSLGNPFPPRLDFGPIRRGEV